MKRISQYVAMAIFSGLLCVALAQPADAQRRGTGGGGGAGGGGGFSRGGGGAGGGFSRGGGFSTPAPRSNGDFSGGRRGIDGGFNRGGQQNNAVMPRSNNGVTDARRGTFNRDMNGRQPNVSPRSNNNFYNNPNVARRGTVSPRRGVEYNTSRGGFYRGNRYYPGRVVYGNRYYNNRFYGNAYGPWGRYGGYYFNRGFYSSLYYPRLGFSIGVLPYGYYPFYWGGAQFYMSDGYFYQYNNNQYTVVEPPLGAALTQLPEGAESIVINGEQYYELNGVYYQAVTKDDGSVVYEVVGKDGQLDTTNYNDVPPPTIPEANVGEIVTDLPPDTRKVNLNGETFLVSPDQYYYQEIPSDTGVKTYKVVAVPIIEPAN